MLGKAAEASERTPAASPAASAARSVTLATGLAPTAKSHRPTKPSQSLFNPRFYRRQRQPCLFIVAEQQANVKRRRLVMDPISVRRQPPPLHAVAYG